MRRYKNCGLTGRRKWFRFSFSPAAYSVIMGWRLYKRRPYYYYTHNLMVEAELYIEYGLHKRVGLKAVLLYVFFFGSFCWLFFSLTLILKVDTFKKITEMLVVKFYNKREGVKGRGGGVHKTTFKFIYFFFWILNLLFL